MIRIFERELPDTYVIANPDVPQIRVFTDKQAKFEMSEALYEEMGSPKWIEIRVEAKP